MRTPEPGHPSPSPVRQLCRGSVLPVPLLKVVEVYPYSGWWGQPWVEGDPDADAFARVARGVCDLYSEHLAAAGVTHAVSSVRVFVGELADAAAPAEGEQFGLTSPTWTGRPQGFEAAAVSVPAGFASWPTERQREAALDVVHRAAAGVARHRGLAPEPFEAASDAARAAGHAFTWHGPWRSAPGRVRKAQVQVRTAADGHGRLRVRVESTDGTTVESDEFVAWTTRESYVRAAKTLRWEGPETLRLQPAVGPFGLHGGEAVLRVEGTAGGLQIVTVQAAAPPTQPTGR